MVFLWNDIQALGNLFYDIYQAKQIEARGNLK